jgi:phosphomannomutase
MAGLTTTPQIYWGTSYFNFEASVQITASHNAKEYNGLKISRGKTVPVGYDTGLAELEEMITTEQIKIASTPGKIIEFPFHDEYLAFLKEHLDDISNMKIGIDASNGMAGLFVL